MKKTFLIAVAICTVIAGIVLFILGKPVLPEVIFGAILWFLVYTLWNPPIVHEEVSEYDRLKAIDYAVGDIHDNEFMDHHQ